jgi:tetratricopeptide (TPR) repeat protein
MTSAFPKALSAITALSFSVATLRADTASELLIEKGDPFATRLQAAEALKFYLPAERLDPKNVHLVVRIAREYRHLMSDATKTEEKLRLGGLAVDCARRAVDLDPNDPEAQLAVAISYGKLLPLEGTRERIDASRIIKKAADKVIELDPRNDLAWHVLGRWHYALADVGPLKRAMAQVAYGKLPASTYEEAVICYEKAIELKSDRLVHYIELGRAFSKIGRNDDARRYIKKGLAMRETEKDDPEAKREGREILAKLP